MSDFITIQPRPSDPTTWVLAGELDIDTVPEVAERLFHYLRAPLGPALRISCAGVDFVDTAGLHALGLVREVAAEQGVEITLVDHSPAMVRVLALLARSHELDDAPSA